MKKQEVKIVKAAVQRSAKLDQGMKVELDLTDAKEQKRQNKVFKPFAADPIVEAARHRRRSTGSRLRTSRRRIG